MAWRITEPRGSTRALTAAFVLGAALVAGPACSGDDTGDAARAELSLRYDEASKNVRVLASRVLGDGETLHARVRRGAVGALDCARDQANLDRIDDQPLAIEGVAAAFAGPTVEPEAFESPYDSSWLEGEPTADMLARIADGEYVVDVCWMNGATVVAAAELDVRRALDRAGSNGKFDGNDPEERIASVQAYGERCVAELGEIPFFEKLGDGDYETYDCLDSVPLATTVTDADGMVSEPETEVQACDRPQYIYSLCEPNAVTGRTNGPRVTSGSNEQGTHWVLLCRKARAEEGAYNDIAMIGHNPYTGKTCFFQNALYSKTDGLRVPHPADKTQSETSPAVSETLWSGIHGGLGSGIECAECHDADPFIHTPWIDQALDANGDPVVPKMGIDDDFGLGFNDAPYSLVNSAGQGWNMPRQLTSPEASACTRCHRIGDGRWSGNWMARLNGTDAAWDAITTPAYLTFEHRFWMPPELEGLDQDSWPDSDYALAMKFILECGRNRDNPACTYAALPEEPLEEEAGLPEIDLEGGDLAKAALAVLGADIEDTSCANGDCATRRCAECHSISKSGLRRWLEDTNVAWSTCGLAAAPSEMSEAEARAAVDCLRVEPTDGTSVFEAAKLGVLTTGVQYGYFRELFRKAYGDAWLPEYTRFKARVSMPKGNHPKLSQREHAIVAKWFRGGLAALDESLPEPPPPATCTEALDTAAITAHVDAMAFEGWGALNAESGLRMFGCTSSDPKSCFKDASFPDRQGEWGTEAGALYELRKFDFRTSFWTRSSPDGRYVGNGGGNGAGATMTDLLSGTDIGVASSYDPGFFPDNSGFIFQGGGNGAGICALSVLDGATRVTFDEPQCVRASGINLYQHVARGLGGGDYFVINSQFVSDAGGSATDPGAPFNASSTMKFTPMVFDGSVYRAMPPVIVDSPYEGDSVLSPSAALVASRLAGPEGRSLGYVVRSVRTSRFGDAYRVELGAPLATLCSPGAKPNFSFDERFMVTHTHEGTKANILLVDLLTGERRQVTNMPDGHKALFPHFRSDGWFYFLVKSPAGEFLVASDAALRAAEG